MDGGSAIRLRTGMASRADIVALLSWFDEPCELLDDAIVRCKKLGIQTVLAMDGAYGLVPGNKFSSKEQYQALYEAADREGVTLAIRACIGETEVRKRNALFDWARESVRATYYYVLDSDEVLIGTPTVDVPTYLAETMPMVGAVRFWDEAGLNIPRDTPLMEKPEIRRLFMPEVWMPRFFRADLNPWIDGKHNVYRSDDGLCLWGRDDKSFDIEIVEPARIPVDVDHQRYRRGEERLRKQAAYYAERARTGTE